MIELSGLTWDHPRGYQPLEASAAPYAARAGVRVRWERRSLKEFGDAPIEEAAARHDILIIDHPHVGRAALTGCLVPFDRLVAPEVLARLAAESAGPSHESYSYAGRQWALAVDAAMQASVLRPDLLDDPPPRTWDEVLGLARRLGTRLALPLQPTDAACSFLSICVALGEHPARGERLVAAPAGREALRILVELRALAHPGSLRWNPIALLDHMGRTDEVAFCPLTFCYTNHARPGFVPRPLRFSDAPGGRGSILGGAGFAVSARSRHPEDAAAYGAWLAGAEIQRTLYVEEGGQPGNAAAWRDERANRLTGGFFRDTWETLRQAWVRPREPWWPGFQEAAGNAIHAFLGEGGGRVAGCLDRLERLHAAARLETGRGAARVEE